MELARNSPENTTLIVEELIRMHHTYNESLSKEFEYEPPIERRALCNFVGLKNAGATCYMNSVLQQLYNVPNISDQVNSESLVSIAYMYATNFIVYPNMAYSLKNNL